MNRFDASDQAGNHVFEQRARQIIDVTIEHFDSLLVTTAQTGGTVWSLDGWMEDD